MRVKGVRVPRFTPSKKTNELPHYVRAVTVIRDIRDINRFVEDQKEKYILETRNFSDYSSKTHPLNDVMDKFIRF